MQIIQQRIQQDTDTLKKLQAAGDDEQLVRYVDHSFESDDENKLTQLQEQLTSIGFENFDLHSPKETSQFLLECTSIDCTEFHNIAKTSVLMALLAEHYQVTYSGWGCAVASESV
ncbi:MAG: hypothetical protein GJ680_03185 [Alteromonadaceae bacterium]|nr:hypothetical protein [Alteromonadaceae bacterium]